MVMRYAKLTTAGSAPLFESWPQDFEHGDSWMLVSREGPIIGSARRAHHEQKTPPEPLHGIQGKVALDADRGEKTLAGLAQHQPRPDVWLALTARFLRWAGAANRPRSMA